MWCIMEDYNNQHWLNNVLWIVCLIQTAVSSTLLPLILNSIANSRFADSVFNFDGSC